MKNFDSISSMGCPLVTYLNTKNVMWEILVGFPVARASPYTLTFVKNGSSTIYYKMAFGVFIYKQLTKKFLPADPPILKLTGWSVRVADLIFFRCHGITINHIITMDTKAMEQLTVVASHNGILSIWSSFGPSKAMEKTLIKIVKL